jgi:hypothetical protein
MNYESIINKIQVNNGWTSSIVDEKWIKFIHDDIDNDVENGEVGVHDIIVVLNKKSSSITTPILNFWRPFY